MLRAKEGSDFCSSLPVAVVNFARYNEYDVASRSHVTSNSFAAYIFLLGDVSAVMRITLTNLEIILS